MIHGYALIVECSHMEMLISCPQLIYKWTLFMYHEFMNKKKKWVKGKNITISPEAHEILIKQTIKGKVRKNLRQIINEWLGLPLDA